MIWFLLAVLIVVLIILLAIYMRKDKDKTRPPAPVENLAELSVAAATIGDNISIRGAGDDYADLNFTVDRKNRHEADGDKWIELSGRYNGRRIYVEVSEDDEVEVTVDLSRVEIALGDLGLNEDDLLRLDESQDQSESTEYDGSTWRYESSHEISCFKDDGAGHVGYYGWDFREQDGERILSVEKWEGEPFEVCLARRVNSDDVQVFRS